MVVCAERLRRYPVEVELAGPTPVHHPNDRRIIKSVFKIPYPNPTP